MRRESSTIVAAPAGRAVLLGAIIGAALLGGGALSHLEPAAAHAAHGRRVAVIVALGDSITYGTRAGPLGRAVPWTAVLARRLGLNVVNAGIPGNTVVAVCRRCGVPAVVRLNVDALAVPGIRTLIVLEGINDVIHGARATAIIAGLRQIAARAQARRVRVIAGTLLPYDGCRWYHSRGERVRAVVNAWIRTAHIFDGVIDFARLMAARDDPLRLNPAYDSGDGLHPNAAGYRAMGDAIPLSLLR